MAAIADAPGASAPDSSGQLHVRLERGATICGIDGHLDATLVAFLGPQLSAAIAGAADVVLELDHAVLADADALDALVELVIGTGVGQFCLVVGRPTARLVLERWGFGVRCAVFTSTGDALQARTFSVHGYGRGWSPR